MGDGAPCIDDAEVLLIGGGIAAMWTLARLRGLGFRAALIEPARLGQGQTLASQGIIHGGLKYTLSGLFNQRAAAVAAMPSRWRAALHGHPEEGDPNLHGARVLSPHCLLWRSRGIAGALGMIGARAGLETTPVLLTESEIPPLLHSATGGVYRVDEPVVNPASVLESLRNAHLEAMLTADGIGALEWDGQQMRVRTPSGECIRFNRPKQVIVAAGAASEGVLRQLGVAPPRSSHFVRRALHMGLVRAKSHRDSLPPFFGHNVDGKETRVTITSGSDTQSRCVWQVGGRLAEDGVAMESKEFHARLRRELREVLPLLDQDALEFSSYRVDRMEFAMAARQEEAALLRLDSHIIAALPLKLALAPLLAQRIESDLRAVGVHPTLPSEYTRSGATAPSLGAFPWEACTWTS